MPNTYIAEFSQREAFVTHVTIEWEKPGISTAGRYQLHISMDTDELPSYTNLHH